MEGSTLGGAAADGESDSEGRRQDAVGRRS